MKPADAGSRRLSWTEREAAFANDTTFARFLILREVIRQPRTANSLETMGLLRVCFRHIEETITTPPSAFTRHGGTLADWRDFLTLALTRVFRGNVAVDTDRESLHWIMPDVPKRFIVPPGSNTYGDKKLRAWPQPSMTSARRPIIVSLLAAGLKLDFDNPAHRDDLIACMGQAWEAIWPLLKVRLRLGYTARSREDYACASAGSLFVPGHAPDHRSHIPRSFPQPTRAWRRLPAS